MAAQQRAFLAVSNPNAFHRCIVDGAWCVPTAINPYLLNANRSHVMETLCSLESGMNDRLRGGIFWVGFAAIVSAIWLSIPLQP